MDGGRRAGMIIVFDIGCPLSHIPPIREKRKKEDPTKLYIYSPLPPCRLEVFATLPDSSINSWDSWLFLTCGKINTCYYTNNSSERISIRKRLKRLFVVQ
jgi:hypothetical protein